MFLHNLCRLKSHYEEVRGGMLSRTDLMQDFQQYCARFGRTSGYTLMQLLRLVKYVCITSIYVYYVYRHFH